MQVDRPAPLFQKRNSTRIVLKNRNRVSKPPVTTPPPTTTTQFIELPKVSRKTLRRKVTRNPIFTTTKAPAALENYEQFSEVIDDELAGVLPALTSAKPRKTTRPVVETSTRTLQPQKLINFEPVQTIDPALNSFDKILEHQYKIKGIDISSEESYQDEKLIGVLGSQIKVVLHSLSNDPSSVQVECLDVGNFPHPTDCVKYIQCAKGRGYIQGQIYDCGPGLSFQVGGTCAASKGCTRNNVRLMNH